MHSGTLDGLLGPVESIEVFLVEERGISRLSYALDGAKPVNLRRAPHLVRVQLVRAPELVSVRLLVDA